MRTSIFLFFLLCVPVRLCSQSDSVLLYNVHVLDAFYETSVKDAHVSVYEKDSTTLLVDSLQMFTGDWGKRNCVYRGNVPRRRQVVLRARREGYGEEYLLLDIPARTDGVPTKRYAAKNALYLWQESTQNLSEANVTASRILMVMKGDTIEYNAAAFRMQQGSMLDNLVRALPGVQLDDNGRITVNGEYVSSLLVNGRDFFKGDPKVALRNLPAYAVNKVKVYRHSDKRRFQTNEELDEMEKRQDPLVMDVALKRDYAQGWISNYELGGGSTLRSPYDARWMGRLFALRYTNHSSLGFYAGANNLNDGGMPGSKGEWKKMDASDGEKETYMAGIDFSLDPKDTGIKFNTAFQAQREEALYESVSHGTDYYESGDIFHESSQRNKDKTVSLNWNASLKADDKLGYSHFTPSLHYTHNKRTSSSSSSNRQDAGTGIDTLYTRTGTASARSTRWGADVKLTRYFHAQRAGDFTLKGTFTYDRTPTSTRLETDGIIYKMQSGDNLSELRSYALPESNYSYAFRVLHEKKKIRISKRFEFSTELGYEYGQQFKSGHQDVAESNDDWLTPSSAITWTADVQNSFHTTRMERTHSFTPQAMLKYKTKRGKTLQLYLSPYFDVVSRSISDRRNNLSKAADDNNALFNPSATLALVEGNLKTVTSYSITASVQHTLPDIYHLLGVRDDSDPLLRYEGNPGLNTTRQQSVSIGYDRTRWGNGQQFIVSAGYDKWSNSVGTARLYDRTTGVTTLRPYNIDGNWQASARIICNSFIGKGRKWNISNTAKFNLARSTDFASDRSDEALRTSSADNLSLTDNLQLDWRIKNMRLSAKADVKWTRLTSRQHLFDRLSYTDFDYGLSLSTPLVWGFDLATDLMAYCRRGYADRSMNTTDWVWNLELSRALGQRKQWLIKAVGFDILGQISSVRHVVNAQGRTETWYNTMPSYATLHIVYRLDIKPKK